MKLRINTLVLALAIIPNVQGAQRAQKVATADIARTLTVVSEPNAIVWVDEIRRGTTDTGGRLTSIKLLTGAHTLRVRASGFRESSLPIPATQRGEVRVRLVRTTDDAELTFQQAETARETARDDTARQNSVDLYRKALRLRQSFPAAHVGLARVLLDLNDT